MHFVTQVRIENVRKKIYYKTIFFFCSESIFNLSGVTTFDWKGDYNITFIEAIDQTNGTGGYVYHFEGGIGFRHVILFFNARQGDPIKYNIRIFGNIVAPNDFKQGTYTNTSFMVYK